MPTAMPTCSAEVSLGASAGAKGAVIASVAATAAPTTATTKTAPLTSHPAPPVAAPSATASTPSPSLALPPVVDSVLSLIGNTPMLRVSSKLDTGPCELFLKLECQSIGGSIKDRIAVSMVAAAEASGALRPFRTPPDEIFEGTAGNTGLALALVAAQRGYALTVVVPDKMSPEKVGQLRALGATVVLTRSDVEKGHADYYQDVAERLAGEARAARLLLSSGGGGLDGSDEGAGGGGQKDGGCGEPAAAAAAAAAAGSGGGVLYANQFGNAANPAAHFGGTGPEIWAQMEGKVDAFVCGVGSGGTLAGCGAFLRAKNPAVDLILADPEGSVLAPLVNAGQTVAAGSWAVEGIGEDFVPSILPLAELAVTRAITVSDADAFAAARALLKAEGVLAGSSTGVLLAAALRYCRAQTSPKRVVTFACDTGTRYLSKQYNSHWLRENGYETREEKPTGGVLDLIARRHADREDFTATPDLPLSQIIRRFRAYDISQLAVVVGGRVVGIIDETDVLLALVKGNNSKGTSGGGSNGVVGGGGATGDGASPPSSSSSPPPPSSGAAASDEPTCGDVMTSRVETVPPTARVEELLPLFRADRVAVVAGEGGQPYYGLVTKIDLIAYLRRAADEAKKEAVAAAAGAPSS